MRISVLGGITVDGDARNLGPRDYVVLAALTVRRGAVVSAETLADALWGGAPPASWNKVIQGCVVRLRKALGTDVIETRSHGYRLITPSDAIDIEQFEDLVARGRELLALGEPHRAEFVLRQALALWRGRALPELESWEPGRIEAARLEELRLDVEEMWLDAALRAGRYREILAEAQARAAEQPLREARWALLARAQYQAGRQGDALQTLRQARSVLVRELGLDPGPGLATLEEAILRQDPALVDADPLTGPANTCPYLGLVPYDVGDAEAYFGREADVSECLGRLADVGFLAVVGPSGSGKSSLVRAGVVASLRREGREAAIITPGDHPMQALADVDWPRAGDSVLVVDQCEEAVALCADVAERGRFFATLAAHADSGHAVVIALRADRLGDVSAHPAFARLVESGLYLLKDMVEADLRAAIEGPARQAGLLCEPGLVDLVVRDVLGEPGALPLLSHAMRQTWERREDRVLTVAGYQQTGGIRGAVARSAEQVYEQAPPRLRPVLRDLLLRLVAPSPDGDPVRSRVPRRVVAADPEHEQVIEQLVTARLVTSHDDVVELAHEALARAWPRLRSWLDDDMAGQRILRHLSAAADGWEAMGRPDSELYRGTRLAQALDWRDSTRPKLTPVELEFLHAGERMADREQNAARRRRRLALSGLALGTAVAMTLAAVAFVSQQRAEQAADVARARELAAAAINVIGDDPSLSKLLAVASATGTEPTLETISALHRALDADKVVDRYTWPEDQTMFQLFIDFDAESGLLAATAMGGHLEVVDWTSGERLWAHTVEAEGYDVDEFEFGAPSITDGGERVVASVHWVGSPHGVEAPSDVVGVHIWDGITGELLDRLDLGPCGGTITAVSDTHVVAKTLAGRPEEKLCDWVDAPTLPVELVEISSGERTVLAQQSLSVHELGKGGALSGEGRRVAIDVLDDGGVWSVVVMDVVTGERVLDVVPSADQEKRGVRALNDDGSLLLYGDRPMQVWDVARGAVAASFDGHNGESMFATFAPSGTTVYSTGMDGILRRWDAATGRELDAVGAVGHGPVSVVDDEFVLVSSFWAGHASFVDLHVKGEVGAIQTCSGGSPPNRLRVVDGLAAFQIYCAGDADATTYIASVAGGPALLHEVPGHHGDALDVSPDGTRFVRQDGDGTVHGPLTVRDLRTGEPLVELDGLCAWDEELPDSRHDGCMDYPETPFRIWADVVRWSPDGSMIAAADGSEIVVWDAHSGALLFAEDGGRPDRLFVADMIFSPDSTRLVASGVPDGFRVLSTSTWDSTDALGPLQAVGENRYPGLLGYSPDGATLLAVGGLLFIGAAGELQWIDAETLELIRVQGQIHDGAVRAAALSPDGTRIATGSSDGFVRVWAAETGELIHEVPLAVGEVHGVAFVDDAHVAVAPDTGNLLMVTVDPDELLDLVRSSLTHGFTPTECARFNFGDDCPTLAELRG